MKLVKIAFSHYSPKDSKKGIKEYVVADSLDEVLLYVDKEHMYGTYKDAKEELDESCFYPEKDWLTDEKKAEAIALGLNVDEYDGIEGPKFKIIEWLKNTMFEEVSDAYYGATQWDWSESQDIIEDEVNMLIKLGVAKDIRKA